MDRILDHFAALTLPIPVQYLIPLLLRSFLLFFGFGFVVSTLNSNYINLKSLILSHQYLVVVSLRLFLQSGKVNTDTVISFLWRPQMCVIVIDRLLSGNARVCGTEGVKLGFWNQILQYSTVQYSTVQYSTEQRNTTFP